MLAKVVAPVVTGIVLACLGTFGLITSQTSAPSANPASQPVLQYGDR